MTYASNRKGILTCHFSGSGRVIGQVCMSVYLTVCQDNTGVVV